MLFVQELAEVHNLHDWRLGLWRDFHQVQLRLARHPQSILCRNDAYVLAIGADQTDFTGPDLFINSMVFGSYVIILLSNFHYNRPADVPGRLRCGIISHSI